MRTIISQQALLQTLRDENEQGLTIKFAIVFPLKNLSDFLRKSLTFTQLYATLLTIGGSMAKEEKKESKKGTKKEPKKVGGRPFFEGKNTDKSNEEKES